MIKNIAWIDRHSNGPEIIPKAERETVCCLISLVIWKHSTYIHINQFHLHFNMQVIAYYIHAGTYVVIDYCSLFTVDFHKFVFYFLESSFAFIVQSSVLIIEFLVINSI